MNIREQSEEIERKILSPHAALSAETKGRMIYEEPCSIRTDYQRDRDRIIHSKSFRRMKHKTQVFLSPTDDHYRTRLTHVIEVSQIARTISKALRLNENLSPWDTTSGTRRSATRVRPLSMRYSPEGSSTSYTASALWTCSKKAELYVPADNRTA